jgi:putative ABC transport system ATP-binding protein
MELNAPLVQARDLTRRWGRGTQAQLGVDRVDLNIGRGELASIVGPSGSGKSTLGALIAGIDTPSSGSLVVDGTRIDSLSNDRLARWRGRTVGIIFQEFHLIPTLTAEENVALSVQLADRAVRRTDRRDRSREALGAVGLADKAGRLPAQLSGGEQQRVAIARAIVTRPRLIVADEPTGSLDQASGHGVFELLAGLTATGTTVVLITHDRELAAGADRQIAMLDGRIATHTAAGVDMSCFAASDAATSGVASVADLEPAR